MECALTPGLTQNSSCWEMLPLGAVFSEHMMCSVDSVKMIHAGVCTEELRNSSGVTYFNYYLPIFA